MLEARRPLALAIVMLLALAALFLFWQLRAPFEFILTLRATKLASLVLVGAAAGATTILFQTVAGNRLLTPGIVGFDALFIFLQTLLVMVLGGVGFTLLPDLTKFLIETGLMIAVAMALFGFLLRKGAEDILRMILTGVILGILLRGLAGFAQRLLDPSEFAIVQQAMFASFGAVDRVQLSLAAALLIPALLAAMSLSRSLDVALLGRQKALSLGLEYDRLVLGALALIAAMVAASTALVGPVAFLGLLAASLARVVFKTERHQVLVPGAAIIGAIILVAGQTVFERFLGLQSTLAVIVEFFGGLLFLILVLRARV